VKKKHAPKIIVALDGMSYGEAIKLATLLEKEGALLKVNDLLDTDKGLSILSELGELGEVMDDPKLHDIPNTMYNRVKRHAAFNPKFITIHASNTVEALHAAKKAAEEIEEGPIILGITVLTTFKTEECEGNLGGSTRAKVLQYARAISSVHFAKGGIVCSGQELEFLSEFSDLDNLIRVVPAIRSINHPVKNDDQKRTLYIPDAVNLGADYFVIGRPITQAPDPVQAFHDLQTEIGESWEKCV
jgi:orotidine-5'-phosphate decarboxylase